MAETVALSKFACPACGGEAIWNPAKQKLVCPFCGTESPAKLDADGRDRRARSRRARCAASATTRAAGRRRSGRSNARAATRSRCSIPRGRRRTASSAARRSSCRTQETKPAFRPESVLPFKVSRGRGARRASARGTASCGSRRHALKKHGADRHGARRLPAVLDIRCARRRRMDRRGRPLLLHDRNLRRGRPHADAPGAARALGAGGRARAALLRRRPRLRVGRRPSGAAARHRAVSDRRSQALRRRLRRRLGRRALPDRSRRRRAARARGDGRKLQALCAQQVPGDTFRNLQVRPDYSGQTFKHILAPVWLLSYTFGARASSAR